MREPRVRRQATSGTRPPRGRAPRVAAAFALALAASPGAADVAGAPASALPAGREVELRAVGAPLPVVLGALADTLGVELRPDGPLLASPPLVTETLRGDAADALERLVERFGLALFVDGSVVWIDSPGYRHSHAVAIGPEDPEGIASAVGSDLADAGGRAERVDGELVLSGPRAAVVDAVRSIARALASAPATGDGPTPAEPVPEVAAAVDAGAADGEPARSAGDAIVAAPAAPTAPEPGLPPDAPVTGARPPAPSPVPADAPRRIDDVADIPGFDSEYVR